MRLQARAGWPRERRAHWAVITITADHPSWGDAWVVRTTARCGNVAGADAAVRQPVRAVRVNAERGGGHVRPLVDLVCCHLDRDRVLARPGRWPKGPQLHRVLHLQPVLLPGRDHRRLPRPGPHRSPRPGYDSCQLALTAGPRSSPDLVERPGRILNL